MGTIGLSDAAAQIDDKMAENYFDQYESNEADPVTLPAADGNALERNIGCIGAQVVAFQQGLRSNGDLVASNRSDPTTVLGEPDRMNEVGGFFSLGFGGWIIIETDGLIYNGQGADLNISETSFGQPDCDVYRESAEIAVSKDLVTWQVVGTICQDAEVNFGTFDFIRYVRITDVSTVADFGNAVVDGYDVDGIKCTGSKIYPFQPQDHPERDNKSAQVFPNPVNDNVSVFLEKITKGETIRLDVTDPSGRIIHSEIFIATCSSKVSEIDLSNLKGGVYLLHVGGESIEQTHRIIKN